MINISSIRSHMYCPMKLYLQTHVDTTMSNDIQLNIELKKIKMVMKFQELLFLKIDIFQQMKL